MCAFGISIGSIVIGIGISISIGIGIGISSIALQYFKLSGYSYEVPLNVKRDFWR